MLLKKRSLQGLLGLTLLGLFSLFPSAGQSRDVVQLKHDYDTDLCMYFGLGYGNQAVRDMQFADFIHSVVTPVFTEGSTTMDARGQWLHPQRGVIKERNVILCSQFKDSEEMRQAVDSVAKEYVERYPGSHASVYVVRRPIVSSVIYFVDR